jgi:hypothetical protein
MKIIIFYLQCNIFLICSNHDWNYVALHCTKRYEYFHAIRWYRYIPGKSKERFSYIALLHEQGEFRRETVSAIEGHPFTFHFIVWHFCTFCDSANKIVFYHVISCVFTLVQEKTKRTKLSWSWSIPTVSYVFPVCAVFRKKI